MYPTYVLFSSLGSAAVKAIWTRFTFLQNLLHTGAGIFGNNKGCRMQAIWFVSPPHNRPSITGAPPLIVQRRLQQQRGRKLAAAFGESDQRPKDWTTNLLLSSKDVKFPRPTGFPGNLDLTRFNQES